MDLSTALLRGGGLWYSWRTPPSTWPEMALLSARGPSFGSEKACVLLFSEVALYEHSCFLGGPGRI